MSTIEAGRVTTDMTTTGMSTRHFSEMKELETEKIQDNKITEPTSEKTTLPHVSDEQRSTLDRFFSIVSQYQSYFMRRFKTFIHDESFGIWSDCIAVSTLEQK